MNFVKKSEAEPYYLTIKCLESNNAEQKIDDLSEEYALNVQGKKCLDYIEFLKKLANVNIIDTQLSQEYYESEINQTDNAELRTDF